MDQLAKAMELFLKSTPGATQEDFFKALRQRPQAEKKAVRVPRRRRFQTGQPRPIWYVVGATGPGDAADRLMAGRLP